MTDVERNAGSPDEIEITPAMIAAGVSSYYRHSEYFETIEQVVSAIFRDMYAAKSIPADGVPKP